MNIHDWTELLSDVKTAITSCINPDSDYSLNYWDKPKTFSIGFIGMDDIYIGLTRLDMPNKYVWKDIEFGYKSKVVADNEKIWIDANIVEITNRAIASIIGTHGLKCLKS